MKNAQTTTTAEQYYDPRIASVQSRRYTVSLSVPALKEAIGYSHREIFDPQQVPSVSHEAAVVAASFTSSFEKSNTTQPNTSLSYNFYGAPVPAVEPMPVPGSESVSSTQPDTSVSYDLYQAQVGVTAAYAAIDKDGHERQSIA